MNSLIEQPLKMICPMKSINDELVAIDELLSVQLIGISSDMTLASACETSIVEACQLTWHLGLSFQNQEAWLLPQKRNGILRVVMEISIRGLLNLLHRSPAFSQDTNITLVNDINDAELIDYSAIDGTEIKTSFKGVSIEYFLNERSQKSFYLLDLLENNISYNVTYKWGDLSINTPNQALLYIRSALLLALKAVQPNIYDDHLTQILDALNAYHHRQLLDLSGRRGGNRVKMDEQSYFSKQRPLNFVKAGRSDLR